MSVRLLRGQSGQDAGTGPPSAMPSLHVLKIPINAPKVRNENHPGPPPSQPLKIPSKPLSKVPSKAPNTLNPKTFHIPSLVASLDLWLSGCHGQCHGWTWPHCSGLRGSGKVGWEGKGWGKGVWRLKGWLLRVGGERVMSAPLLSCPKTTVSPLLIQDPHPCHPTTCLPSAS